MSAGPLGQQAITVQESQLGGRRFAGTFKGGMCLEYLTLTFFLPMIASLLRRLLMTLFGFLTTERKYNTSCVNYEGKYARGTLFCQFVLSIFLFCFISPQILDHKKIPIEEAA